MSFKFVSVGDAVAAHIHAIGGRVGAHPAIRRVELNLIPPNVVLAVPRLADDVDDIARVVERAGLIEAVAGAGAGRRRFVSAAATPLDGNTGSAVGVGVGSTSFVTVGAAVAPVGVGVIHSTVEVGVVDGRGVT